MLARLHLSEDAVPVEPLVWRPVSAPPPPADSILPPAAGPDPEAAAHERERQVREREWQAREREWQAREREWQAREREWPDRVEQTRAEAFREGESGGHARAASELEPVVERLASAIADLAGMRARLRREAEGDLLQLALAIARRVLRRELSVDAGALHGLVLGALERLELREIARVRLHPSQVAAVSELLQRQGGGSAVEVTADPSLDAGGVVFETARGDLDVSMDTQLGEIERGLADCLRRRA
jgi:flagellar assembly protein FliH